jgi:chitosanase
MFACSSSSSSPSSDTATDGGGSGGGGGGADGGGGKAGSDGGTTQSGSDSGTGGGTSDSGGPNTSGYSMLQRHKGEMLTSIWENATTIFNYGYAVNLNDGCGYTTGRVGFCTGTGDALKVIQCFDTSFGTGTGNVLHKYVAALQALAAKQTMTGMSQGSTTTLDAIGSYTTDWKSTVTSATTSAKFDDCQDQIVFQIYEQPSLDLAKTWGLTQPLTIAALYDAEINHGQDGVAAFVKLTNNDMGNSAQTPASAPLSLTDESSWLQHFIKHRLDVCAADSSWKHSVDRLALYEAQREAANWDMSAVIVTNAKASQVFMNAALLDSGYPSCNIASDGSVTGDAECTTPAN